MMPLPQMGATPAPMAAPMPPPQPPTAEQMSLLEQPSWEQVEALLKDSVHRNFRIDIETDSIIASSLESDMSGLKDVLTGVGQFITSAEPLVQSGMLPIDAAKEIVMTIIRRARMGRAVEDAFDKMKPPAPPTDPKAGQAQADQAKMQAQAQIDSQKIQMQAQVDSQAEANRQQFEQQRMAQEQQSQQHQAQLDAQVEQSKQASQAQENMHQNQLEAQREQQAAHNNAVLAQMKIDSDRQLEVMRQQMEVMIAQMNNANRIEVAEVTKSTQLEKAQMTAANLASQDSDDKAIPDGNPTPQPGASDATV